MPLPLNDEENDDYFANFKKFVILRNIVALGLTQQGDLGQQGDWVKSNGEIVCFTKWSIGEPNSDWERYATMYTSPSWAPNERGTWNDLTGDGTVDVICETDRV